MIRIDSLKINKSKNKILSYLGLYTLIFLVVMVLVFMYNFISNKTFIWKADGWEQHYKALLYYSQYLREFFYKLFVEHRIEFNQWDFAIGEGGDVLNTLNYYVIGDPFAFFSFLIPASYMYIYYEFMILLRLYLAGLAFSCFTYSTGNFKKMGILTGAITYVFCYWGMLNSLRHPYFLNPMITFPLIILGVEHIIKKKRPYLFIFSVLVAAISNFYFFYMQVLLTVGYVVIRLIYLYKKDIKTILKIICTIALNSILAVLVAAIILMPVLNAFLSDSRFKTSTPFHLFYPIKYYLQMISNYVSEGDSYWLCMGFAIPTLLAVILLFIKPKNRFVKFVFGISFVIMLIPAFGQILNGMSYMCNRWCFAFALLNAYTICLMWDDLVNIKVKESFIILVVMVVYMGLCIIIEYARNTKSLTQLMLGLVLLIILIPVFKNENGTPIINKKTKEILILLVAIISIALNSFYKNSVSGEGYIKECVSSDDVGFLLDSNENQALIAFLNNSNLDTSFVRYTGSKLDYNSNMLYNLSSSQYYWTLTNQYVSRFRSRLGLTLNTDLPHKYAGYDDRTFLLSLSSTMYYVVDITDNVQIPNGFVYIGKYLGYEIYKNVNALPLAYSYDSFVTEDQLGNLNGVELQEVMMNSLIVSNSEGNKLKNIEDIKSVDDKDSLNEFYEKIGLSSESLDFVASPDSKDAIVNDNNITITKAGASVTFTFNGRKNTETYFVINGMDYDYATTYDLYKGKTKYDPNDNYNKEGWDNLEYYEKSAIFSEWLFHKISSSNVELNLVASNGSVKNMRYFTPNYSYYNGEKDFCVNMGYSNDAVNSITITFPKVGIYSFDDIKIMSQETDKVSSYVNKLSEYSLSDITIDNDEVSGTLDADSDRLLTFSIPYSRGWEAYIDGVKTSVFEGNLTYMSIYVPKGEHTIKLVYNTPLFKEGKIISIIGIILIIAYIISYERRLKKGKKNVQGS